MSPPERGPTRAIALVMAVAAAGCAGVRGDVGGIGAGGAAGGQTGGASGGSGGSTPTGGGHDARSSSEGDNCDHELRAVVRDFRGSDLQTASGTLPKHPDFEYAVADDRGIVTPNIGPDAKPVYAGGASGTTTTHGQAPFDQWYRDVDGVNQRFEVAIPLTADPARPGVFVYDSDLFFPIDDMGWGNQYQSHNYDFTSEIHVAFTYRGGEVFNFRGDDDVFLFVNGHLAIDLGGVHPAQTGSVDMDARATELEIAPGNTYRLDIFQAERHVAGSTFHVETTLQCIDNIVP
jgi:fibro-slime domain-containing protein